MGVTQVQRLGTGHRHARLCSGTAPAVISTRTTPIQPASSTARHVLGPERLPEAIRWVPRTVEQVKAYAATAKQQLDSEELAELRRPIEQLRRPLADLVPPIPAAPSAA